MRGALKSTFAGTPLAGNVFAKTGSERHTRALSGFLQTQTHGAVAFSLLVNDWIGDDRDASLTKIESELLSAFLAQRPP